MIKINGIVPLLSRKLKFDEDEEDTTVDRKTSVLEKVGEIHEIVIVRNLCFNEISVIIFNSLLIEHFTQVWSSRTQKADKIGNSSTYRSGEEESWFPQGVDKRNSLQEPFETLQGTFQEEKYCKWLHYKSATS